MNLSFLKGDLSFLKGEFPKKRAAVTIAAVILVVGVVAGREKPALELVQERAPRAAVAADDGIDLDKLRRGEASLPQNDPFSRKNFGGQNPVAPVAVPNVPAKPVAPPLPFQYFGKLIENGKTEVFVMRGEELLSIAAGQKVGDYRVDQLTDSSISFTYLPLKMKQTLDLPAVN
jgi:hypothetical protein